MKGWDELAAMMLDSRSFLTTRGRILVLLKKRGSGTVAYLSEQLQLTRNAIRQHLSALERDNLVTRHLVKTGPTKPSLSYSLTPQAESLFPKRYARLLLDLVQELLRQEGHLETDQLLSRLGYSAAGSYVRRMAGVRAIGADFVPIPSGRSRDRLPVQVANGFDKPVLQLEEVKRILEEEGGIVELEQRGLEVVIRDFNCPYAAVVKVYPSVCQVQRNFLQRLLEPATVDLACDHQEARCQFHVKLSP